MKIALLNGTGYMMLPNLQKEIWIPLKQKTQISIPNQVVCFEIMRSKLSLLLNKILSNHPNVLNLKPTVLGSDTDIILSTLDDAKKVRRYFFHLKSGKSVPEKTTYAIKFTYPREEQEQLFQKIHEGVQGLANTPLNPKLYHWDYSFHGTRSIMPLHIFDDGQFTYMQMKSNQIIPAVFAVQDATGKESVVNYRLVGDTLVIQQVAPQFTLRHGTAAVTSIFNNRLIRQINRNQ